MSKNNHYSNQSKCHTYEAQALHKHSTTGEWRTLCTYRFTSAATSLKSLLDIVARDFRQMGYCPERIFVLDVEDNTTYVRNCRISQ